MTAGQRSSPREGDRSRAAGAKAASILCFASLLWSCAAQEVSGFKWLGADGEALAFAQAERRPAGDEGLIEGPSSYNRYILAKAIELPPGRSIAVDVELASSTPGAASGASGSEGGAAARQAPRLILGVSSEPGGKPALVEAAFPLLDRKARFYLRAKAGSRIASVYARAEGEGSFRIAGISAPRTKAGLLEEDGALEVSSGFKLAIGSGSRRFSIEHPFEGLLQARAAEGGGEAGKPGLVLSYGAAKTQAPPGVIELESRRGGAADVSIRLKMGPGSRTTILDADLFQGDADSIAARAPEGAAITSFYAARIGRADYELADLGRVLAAGLPPEGQDYDLFRWDALPSVIVLVFRDYDLQDRYLKRLAFFVEKAGYRGKLHPDEIIAPLHGWNAHDYRPEDLASFFQKAKSEGFPLSPQELSLEKLLAERGILDDGGGEIRPGTGALISISLETAPALRRTLLVHESTHAIFFADEDYRKLARRTWSSLGDDEKWFWKAYFAWAMYDTGSDYLMANEFQAYLLQQPVASAKEYFTKRKPDELLAKHPELEQKVEEYMKRFGDSFEKRARDLESWLSKKYGFAAGRTYFLEFAK